MTDIGQRCGTVAVARYHSAAGHPTYQYQFDRVTPGRESAGSTHGAEVVYVFGTMGRPGDTVAWSEADRKAADDVQEYWSNFARSGNPNGGSVPEWPRYEPATVPGHRPRVVRARDATQVQVHRVHRVVT